MKWKKENMEEIEEVLESLNKLKFLSKDKLDDTKKKIKEITDEIPQYAEIYKKMKGL